MCVYVCLCFFFKFLYCCYALYSVHIRVFVMAVLLYQESVWWPGVEAKVEILSDGISQPPSTQRPAKPQALTFTTNGLPRSTET